MSYKLVQAAIDMRGDGLSASAWRALVALCRYAGDSTAECYPSTATIAAAARLNPRTVMSALEELRARGWVEWTQLPGRVRRFRVCAERVERYLQPSQEVAGVQEVTGDPCRKLQGTPAGSYRGPLQEVTGEEDREEGKEKIKEESRRSRPFVPDEVASGAIPRSLFADWMRIRKAKRAPLTATAWAGIVREAGKADMTLSETLEMMVERGWQGFKASWRDVQERKAPPAPAYGQQAELTLTAPERKAWDAYIDLVQQGYDRVKWARWAIEKFPGGALEQRARSILYKAGVQA